jgi:hypothetical protein
MNAYESLKLLLEKKKELDRKIFNARNKVAKEIETITMSHKEYVYSLTPIGNSFGLIFGSYKFTCSEPEPLDVNKDVCFKKISQTHLEVRNAENTTNT